MKMKNSYTKKQNDVLELISHLILTKPDAVEGLLEKHGVIFPFPPKRSHLINEVVEMLKEQDPYFNNDLNKLLSVHLKHKGAEIIVLESQKLMQQEDQFLGGLVGGLVKGAVGGISGLFKKKKSSGGGNAAALRQQQAMAAKMKADMDAKMRQMEDDRRRAKEEADRRKREEEDRRRREREDQERRRRDEEDRKRREERDKGSKSNSNLILIGGLAFVTIVGGLVAVGMRKSSS